MEGTTWLFNDGQCMCFNRPQISELTGLVIDHYYHFAAELLLGSWRTYASLDRAVTPLGETVLPPPRRIWFLHQSVTQWSVSPNLISLHQLMNHRRDEPRFNPTVMFAIFPSISLLYPEDFADLANITSSALPKAYMLERALLADRSAAFRGPWTAPTSRTVANALRVGETSRWWWEPIRRQVLRYSGVPDEVINRNLEGTGAMDPAILRQPYIVGPGIAEFDPLAPAGDYAPVITYISRQLSRRRLTADSHDGLVKALEEKSTKLGWELVIVEAEKMTKEEQFALAGRTTVRLSPGRCGIEC